MVFSPSAAPRLHIVEPNEAVQRALVNQLAAAHVEFTPSTLSTQWLAMHDWDFAPSTVVVRAAIRDVWPVLLKVRALRSLRCRAVVILDQQQYPAATRRLTGAGAFKVIDTSQGLPGLVAATRTALEADGLPADEQLAEPAPFLGDRSLQVAALYASALGPTTPQIGASLGISGETVRTHLEQARAIYRDATPELDVSTRHGLRQALINDGQIVGECGWYA